MPGDVDLELDGAGYRTVGLWLSHDELAEMVAEIGAAVQSRTANGPAPDRTRRMLSTVLIPLPAHDDPLAVTADDAPDVAADETLDETAPRPGR